ncbi:MAG: hypothetical protein ACM3JI_02945 [Anaerolineae bacterium]
MNLVEKKKELIGLIMKFLKKRISLKDIQKFSWEMIEYFNKTKKTELPPYQDFEKELWYTIWQIQHLADEEHEREGVTRKILSDALDYLQKKKKFPENFIGKRP